MATRPQSSVPRRRSAPSPTQSSSVGSYTIHVAGAAAANYDITFIDGTLTVTPATLTVRANNVNRTYGQNNPALTGTVDGLVTGDNIIALYSTAATFSSPVGVYAITAALSDPSHRLSNYNNTVNLIDGSLSIGRATLYVVAFDSSKVYGQGNPTLAIGYGGLVNGDIPSVLSSYPTATVDITPRPTSAHTRSTFRAALARNYDVVFVDGTMTVTPAPLTVLARQLLAPLRELEPDTHRHDSRASSMATC